MSITKLIASVVTATVIALFSLMSLSAAQEVKQSSARTPSSSFKHKEITAKQATSPPMRSLAWMSHPSASDKQQLHHLILQVNTNDAAAMNLALNNATNVTQYYKELGEKVKVEVITFGPGLHMLRDDTSPVKARIEEMALSAPEVSFKACGNTQEKMHKTENKDIPIIAQAQVVPSGVVHVMELQERGWTYVKP